jgi:hypothetical protein
MLFSNAAKGAEARALNALQRRGGRFDPDATPSSGHHCNDIAFAPHNLALPAPKACKFLRCFNVLTPHPVS